MTLSQYTTEMAGRDFISHHSKHVLVS